MEIHQQELQKAIEFVRQTFADRKINLDYSPASVKNLDKLFDAEFKNGKLQKPEGSFAKFQGLIMTGVSGYIAMVVIKNTGNTQLNTDATDERWFMNFKVVSSSGQSIQPGLRVVKRMLQGEAMSLYSYTLSSIRYFSPGAAPAGSPDQSQGEINKKPWWKFW